MATRRIFPDNSTTHCDRCGQPAAWRTRVISTCCVLGESLCDRCERKSLHTRWWNRNENTWHELAGDAGWLTGKITAGLGSLKKQIEAGLPRPKPGTGWARTITNEKTPP